MKQALNPNARVARMLAEEFERSGVTDACITPGSRSTALVLALARSARIRPWVLLDERSAAFFALGMARETRRPVILLCTSGTAAANYLPALVEASLSRVPLLAITADRPPELRDCHAPQTIDQVRLFGSHVRWSVDVAAPGIGPDLEPYYRSLACRAVAAALAAPRGPVHINLPMREPLVDIAEELAAPDAGRAPIARTPPYVAVHGSRSALAPATLAALATKLKESRRTIVILGPGMGERPAIAAAVRLAARLGCPILADPLSGARFGRHDRSLIVDSYDAFLRDDDFCRRHQPDAVIQLGMPPVSKALALFIAQGARRLHLLIAPDGTWPDPLERATDLVRAEVAEFCAALADQLQGGAGETGWLEAWLEAGATTRAALGAALARQAVMGEGRVFVELGRLLPPGTALHVGNSMPVRDLDTFMPAGSADLEVFCNRGANGIDGVMSAAMGAAAARSGSTVLVVGDLSFLHDIGALQIAARHRIHLLVIVIHNDGGGIFSFLPQASLGEAFETFFGTPHGLELGRAVEMVGGRHARVSSWEQFSAAVTAGLHHGGLQVVEVPSDRARNAEMHREAIGAALEALRARRRCGAPR